MMRDLLIKYLNTNDVNALAQFLNAWIEQKTPSRTEHERHIFIQTYIDMLIHVPVMFDDRYQHALTQLLDVAKAELEICTIVSTQNYKHVIKY